ncbi:MAG TPA: ThuA domain-containing protein [Candidatus Hydrogenedentes bacterium]|nr:ThuA domain-containing protein [Candidatus Hydrogenedentota bacterium]
MKKFVLFVALAAIVLTTAADAAEGDVLRLLFLTKSQGFEHSVIAEKDAKPSWAARVLKRLADDMGAELTCTKDAGMINAEGLADYDIVLFYTQGDLTQAGGRDGAPAMDEHGVSDLLAWIEAGGRFMGFHSASDTFHSPKGGPVTPYLEMVGGEFCGHGQQFEGVLRVVDPDHPTMAHIPETWRVREEWYCFDNINREKIHVLALLDPAEERTKQEMYNIPAYPMIWCREYGKGRVYFNGMGHREDVWMNDVFKQSIVDAIDWLMNDGPALAEPNCDKVFPQP